MSSLSFQIEGDTEFLPVLGKPTEPHSIGLAGTDHEGNDKPFSFMLHPNHTSNRQEHQVFKGANALFDYVESVMGFKVETVSPNEKRGKHVIKLQYYMYWSFKDIEHLFSDRDFYREHVLPRLSRTRRISGSIPLPMKIKVGSRYYFVNLEIVDISAMQGAIGLKTAAKNVGIPMDTKETYTIAQKKNMPQQYDNNPVAFVAYNKGDMVLRNLKNKTVAFYNWVASVIDVEPRDYWGMSTGKIVASMVSAWLSKHTGLTVDELGIANQLAGVEALNNLSCLRKTKHLVYLGMVDGGRAVRERFMTSYIRGLLNDIDISGCYGNGLMNQSFPIGNPTILKDSMTLREFLKKYEKQLVPGLWYLRVSAPVMPFRQDVLISKEEEGHTHWENGIAVDGSREDEDRLYDASMVMLRKELRHAALTHDLLQILKGCSSKTEWSWLLDNLIVESGQMYLKKDEVDIVAKLDIKGLKVADLRKGEQGLVWSTKWFRVSLGDLASVLLTERAKVKKLKGKGSPEDQFLKLIINTIYGCIASAYFSKEGVSNIVVGNNITARARALAWMMAKGLGSYMSVTDGGVFDVNKVIFYKSMSLGKLERISQGCMTSEERGEQRKFADEGALGRLEPGSFYYYENSEKQNRKYASEGGLNGLQWSEEDIERLTKTSEEQATSLIDKMAWEHLKKQFSFTDIFKYDQFSFESKNIYAELVLHSKVDYMLIKFNGKRKIALRGADKVLVNTADGTEEKIDDPRTERLFEGIMTGVAYSYSTEIEAMLSLNDYRKGLNSGRFGNLLPHDTYMKPKTFYSHTPLYLPFDTQSDFRNLMAQYESAKGTKDAEKVKAVSDEYQANYLRRD